MKLPAALAALLTFAFTLLGCADPDGVCVQKSKCKGPEKKSTCEKNGGEFHELQPHQQSNLMLGSQGACADAGYKENCGGVGSMTCEQ